jgi:hypothetical protein
MRGLRVNIKIDEKTCCFTRQPLVLLPLLPLLFRYSASNSFWMAATFHFSPLNLLEDCCKKHTREALQIHEALQICESLQFHEAHP